eukprot:4407707-Pyramimonas_sp.AAC.1
MTHALSTRRRRRSLFQVGAGGLRRHLHAAAAGAAVEEVAMDAGVVVHVGRAGDDGVVHPQEEELAADHVGQVRLVHLLHHLAGRVGDRQLVDAIVTNTRQVGQSIRCNK